MTSSLLLTVAVILIIVFCLELNLLSASGVVTHCCFISVKVIQTSDNYILLFPSVFINN